MDSDRIMPARARKGQAHVTLVLFTVLTLAASCTLGDASSVEVDGSGPCDAGADATCDGGAS
jgi:hypothetical protein